MSINDKLKQKLDELDLDRHVNDLVVSAEAAVHSARLRAGEIAAERAPDVDRLLTRVSTSIDERTEGRFAPQLGKVRAQVNHGVARLAEQRRGDDPR